MTGILAKAQTEIEAPASRVWEALTDPDQIKEYMFGSKVETSWEVGSPITWNGEYEGRPYQDKGEVLTYDEPRELSVTHFSPLAGQDDKPENYHTLVYSLQENGGTTSLALTQDNCADEQEAEQFSANWQQMLDGLKAHVEGYARSARDVDLGLGEVEVVDLSDQFLLLGEGFGHLLRHLGLLADSGLGLGTEVERLREPPVIADADHPTEQIWPHVAVHGGEVSGQLPVLRRVGHLTEHRLHESGVRR